MTEVPTNLMCLMPPMLIQFVDLSNIFKANNFLHANHLVFYSVYGINFIILKGPYDMFLKYLQLLSEHWVLRMNTYYQSLYDYVFQFFF